MRQETITIGERDLVYCVGGQLFNQAPNRNPRKVEEIMKGVLFNFRNDVRCFNDNEHRTIRIPKNDIYKFVEGILSSISSFMELNLSQIEFEKGIKVDDEDRAKYAFTSRYDVETSESWKSDFIDLDAFTRNVTRGLFRLIDSEQDCFLCIHPDKSDKCKECLINPDLKNNYECGRKPKGKYTFACKFDCHKSKYICCEECDKKDDCDNRCISKSTECGNVINKGDHDE